MRKALFDVICDISEWRNIFHMYTYKSLVFVAKTLEIMFVSDYQAHGLLLQMPAINCLSYFLKSYV